MLDSYNSYINPKFNRFCLDYKIIIIYILAYLLYLLQLLDIGYFLALKQAYRYSVKQIISRGVNYINKCGFLLLYRQARQIALYRNNIQVGFAATSLVPYSPNRVLLQLYTKYQTPLYPPLNTSQAAKTPYNITKLQKQTALLKRYLKQRLYSLLSLIEQTLSQLIKGCKMVILSTVLLISENKKLCIENQRQKRKRVQRRTYIARGGVLSGAEGASYAQAAQTRHKEAIVEAAAERPQRVVRKCSICKSIEHNTRTCPRRQISSQQIAILNTIVCG